MTKGNPACFRFYSCCNVVFGNALVLLSEGDIISARLPSWCNVSIENVFVLVIE